MKVLFAVILFFAIVAATFPDKPETSRLLEREVLICPEGNKIGALVYEDRLEFYFAPKAEALFGVAMLEKDGSITQIVVQTSRKVVIEYNSKEDFFAAYPQGMCGIGAEFLKGSEVGYRI